jgi:acetyl esterase
MPLHPQAQAMIERLEAMGLPPSETLSVEEGRAFMQKFGDFMIPAEEVTSVVDSIVPGPHVDIPLRIFMPEGEGLRPGILYFHGGGFSTGSIDLVDPVCRALANRSGCAVIAVGYRLAPEHPYPAAVTDAYIAAMWIGAKGPAFGIDSSRLAVVGDGAGGNLATASCMLLRDKTEEVKISLQVLIYPMLDLVEFETPSHQEYGEGYLLTTGMMNWFKAQYLSGSEDRVDESYCSPLRTEDLSNLPPAFVVTADYDPLRDEGVAYAARLKEDGVFVDLRRERGMIHGFFSMGAAIDRGRELLDELGTDIRQTLLG